MAAWPFSPVPRPPAGLVQFAWTLRRVDVAPTSTPTWPNTTAPATQRPSGQISADLIVAVMTMAAGIDPRFVVDGAHLGTSETIWATSQGLAAVLPLDVATFDHVLVVAPHPDDEILGAGGLLQVLAHGRVTFEICAVTDGEASHPSILGDHVRHTRTVESLTALARLNLPGELRRVRLGYLDGEVAHREIELAGRLSARLRPGSLCVAPWRGDGHPDHDACGRAAAAAAEVTGAELVEYLVWTWHWADPLGTDVPWASCRRVDLSRHQTARKRWATSAFRSQIRPFGASDNPVTLPASILRRFWRPFEVYVT